MIMYMNMSDTQILQDVRFNRLQERAKKYLKLDKIEDILYYIALPWALLDVLIAYYYAQSLFIPLGIVGATIPYAIWSVALYKRRKSDLADDEWVRFYSGQIVIDLEEYIKNPETKSECKKNALRNAHHLLSVVESWDIGNFLPVKLHVGDSVNSLSRNLKTRIIPVLRSTDNEEIEKVNQIMYRLFSITRGTFNIDGIQNINSKILEKLPTEKPFKMGPLKAVLAFSKTHTLLKHSIVFAGFVTIVLLVGYIGLVYIGIVKEYVWIGCITLFGILMGAYVAKGRKEEK